MGTTTLFILTLSYLLNFGKVDSIRCGHDDLKYDIFRNDEIEPAVPSKNKLFNPLDSLSSPTGATKWLFEEMDHSKYSTNRGLHDNAQDTDTQTFSSRKNTKPHRHHDSPHAFEHNVHHRHHADDSFFKSSDPVLSLINEQESALDTSIWKPFRIHYNSDALVASWKNQDEAVCKYDISQCMKCKNYSNLFLEPLCRECDSRCNPLSGTITLCTSGEGEIETVKAVYQVRG